MPEKIKRCSGGGPVRLQRCATDSRKLQSCAEPAVCPVRQDADFPLRLRLTWTGPQICDEIYSVYHRIVRFPFCCPPLQPQPSWNASLVTEQYSLRSVVAIDCTLNWNQAAGAWQGTQTGAWTEVFTRNTTNSSFDCFTGQTSSNTVPSESTAPRDFTAFLSCSNGQVSISGTGGLIAVGPAPSPGRTGSPAQWWRNLFTVPTSLVVNHPCTGDLQSSALVGCQCNALCEQPLPSGCAHTNGSNCAGPCDYTENYLYTCGDGSSVPIVAERFLRSGLVARGSYRGGGVVTVQRI